MKGENRRSLYFWPEQLKPVALNYGGEGMLQMGQSSVWSMLVILGGREVWAGLAAHTVWTPPVHK